MMENWQNWIVFWLERLVILEKKDGKGSKLHSQHVLRVTHYSRSCWMLTFFDIFLWHKHMLKIFLSMHHTGDSNIESPLT